MIGLFHLAFYLFAILGLCHYRLYIGLEDKVIVSKAEYEKLKQVEKQHDQ